MPQQLAEALSHLSPKVMNHHEKTLAHLPGMGSNACQINSTGGESVISLGNEWRERSGMEGGGLTALTSQVTFSVQNPHLLTSWLSQYSHVYLLICSLCSFRGKGPCVDMERLLSENKKGTETMH